MQLAMQNKREANKKQLENFNKNMEKWIYFINTARN